MGWPLFAALHPVPRASRRLWAQSEQWYRLSQTEADEFQMGMLRELLSQAGQHVPYYRALFEAHGFEPQSVKCPKDLQALPPLERATVQTRPEELCTDRKDETLFKNSSGGSSGLPVIVYQTVQTRASVSATQIASDMIAGYRVGSPLGWLWGAPGDVGAAKTLKARLLSWAKNELLCDAYDMGVSAMEDFHKQFTRFRPSVLTCYASSLHVFARFLTDRGYRPNYPTKGVISSAELLTPSMREDIEAAFDAPLFNRYGSRETGIMAMECEQHNGMHVVGCNALVEAVDPETNEPVRGKPGDVLATLLPNHGMPLIRYRIGDSVVMTDRPCPCGRPGPMIEEVLGRKYDTIKLADGRMLHGSYFTHLFWRVPGLREFRFIQEGPRAFTLMVVTDERFDSGGDEGLVGKIRELTGSDASIRLEHVDRLAPLPSGKRQFIVNRMDHSEETREQ